ncbi:MAG: 50S ribosomal protein L23 [Candidatus Dojkabacteria bacterium]
MESKNIKIQPVISEKSYAAANALNKYTFLVCRGVNKIEVKKAIENKYKVNVTNSNSIVKPGKEKKNWKTNKRTRKSDMVKMIVTLKKGDKIDEFLKN